MRFDETARTLILERKDCRTCEYGAGERGEYTGRKGCDACKGTGRGPRGGVGKCRPCYGRGYVNDFDNPVPCPTCKGAWENFDEENFCDNAPQNAVLSMPVRLVRVNRDNSWNENYLGLGCLWSVADYGTASESDDATVLAKVREHLERDRTQATKIVRPYERGQTVALLHDTLVIVVTRTGYSVRAMSDLPD